MARRVTLPVGLLAVICSLPSFVLCAQFHPTPAPCSVPPFSKKAVISWRKVIIKDINFDGPIHLTHSEIARVIREANKKLLNADDPDWIKEFTETNLREAWQNQGYFKVYVTAQVRPLSGNSTEERFLVAAHVDEGLQYYLRNIRFRSATDTQFGDDLTFPEATLRAAIPVRDGEIFNVTLIRNGIDALMRLYNSRGYIDSTAVADTEVDDDLRPRISLVLALDPEQQFHAGNIEIVALDPKLEARLGKLSAPEKSLIRKISRIFSKRISRCSLRSRRLRISAFFAT